MNFLYFLALPEPIDGHTTVGVVEELFSPGLIRVTGRLGSLGFSGSFVQATHAMPFVELMSREFLEDLILESNLRGRPVSLPDHEVRSSDITAWIEEAPGPKEERINARREDRRLAAEAERLALAEREAAEELAALEEPVAPLELPPVEEV